MNNTLLILKTKYVGSYIELFKSNQRWYSSKLSYLDAFRDSVIVIAWTTRNMSEVLIVVIYKKKLVKYIISRCYR